MRMKILLMMTSLALIGTSSVAFAQIPAVMHNTWTSGATMPTARLYAYRGAIGTNIYVVDGNTGTETLNVNEIYNTKTNTWTTGASDPTARWVALMPLSMESCTSSEATTAAGMC